MKTDDIPPFEENPRVVLEGLIRDPFDLGIAAARTCYSSKGIIRVDDINQNEKSRALGDKIAASTLEAGHLTTRQHAHFVFSLDKVSRHFIWSFLHSHPFYNSEQVSQRYVRVSPGHVTIPILPEKARAIYIKTITLQMDRYNALIELLLPVIEREFFAIFPQRLKTKDKYKTTLLKRAYEVARYVLPIATHAYLYHTVSALTLMRYHRYQNSYDTPTEQRVVVNHMMAAVMAQDPHFFKDMVDPMPFEDTLECRLLGAMTSTTPQSRTTRKAVLDEFDRALGERTAVLTDYTANAEQTLAKSVRLVLGLSKDDLSDGRAISRVLNPRENPLIADTLNPASLSKLMRTLNHVHYTFSKKLSHTADSQDQRHRLTPASRPVLEAHFTGSPDYITPPLIAMSEPALALYDETMKTTWQAVTQLLDMGVSFEMASYLLPNALSIRFEESGDLLGFHHKWKVRSCYTAQEEIFRATIDEIKAVKAIHPRLAEHILAPCYQRKESGMTPYCPEGDRFCGIRVWKQSIDAYERRM